MTTSTFPINGECFLNSSVAELRSLSDDYENEPRYLVALNLNELRLFSARL